MLSMVSKKKENPVILISTPLFIEIDDKKQIVSVIDYLLDKDRKFEITISDEDDHGTFRLAVLVGWVKKPCSRISSQEMLIST